LRGKRGGLLLFACILPIWLFGLSVQVQDWEQFRCVLVQAAVDYQQQLQVDLSAYRGDFSADLQAGFSSAAREVELALGLPYPLLGYEVRVGSSSASLHLNFAYAKESFEELVEKTQQASQVATSWVKAAQAVSRDPFEVLLRLHDRLVQHAHYLSLGQTSAYIAYGPLLLGKGVCEGYARAFQLLCQQANIPCWLVYGEAREETSWIGHMWNVVQLDGAYYHVDVTWDDPTSGPSLSVPRHDYFLLDDTEIGKNHRWDRASVPACNATKWNYYRVMGLEVQQYPELVALMQRKIEQKAQVIEVKFPGIDQKVYDPWISSACMELNLGFVRWRENPTLSLVTFYRW